MPNSTTLESLTIEINGNSQKASEGIGSLVGSLRSLARGVGTVVPPLKALNAELRQLSRYKLDLSKIANLTNGSITKAARAARAASSRPKPMTDEELKAWQAEAWDMREREFRQRAEAMSEARLREQNPQWYRDVAESQKAAQQYLRDNGGTASWAKDTQKATESFNKLSKSMEKTEPAAKKATTALKNVDKELKQKRTDGASARKGIDEASEASERATPRFQRFFGVMSRIGRIASTMIIRTALKALVKAFSESWQAAYAFSNGINGSFAKSVDAMRTIIYDTTTTVVQTFAPVFQALVPIINAVAGAIQFLCQGIQYLLSLLGLVSDLFGKTASKINRGIGGGGSSKNKNKNKNKNLLADWDELNVIQSKDNGITGSGGGGGYKPGSIAKLIDEEIQAILSVIVGEGLLAVGLILCFTGHIPAGIGLMILGAAAIAKPLTTDWNKLPNETKRAIVTVTSIATASFFALGLILLCAGQIPLGIGMLAIGAANFMLSMSVAWGAEAEIGVRQTVARIMAIGGAGLMAIGLILACCGAIGIGVSMMVAGAAMWYSAYSLDSNAVLELVSGVLKQVGDWFQKTFDDIKVASQIAWKIVSDWWNTNVGDPIKEKWNSVVTFFSTLFGDKSTEGSIAYYANIAWQGISIWWQSGIAAPLAGAWDDFSEFFSGLFDPEISGSLPDLVNEAWWAVSEWWDSSIAKPVEGAWKDFTNFFANLFGGKDTEGSIANYANTAWTAVSSWWNDKTGSLDGTWSGFTEFFQGLFDPEIAGSIPDLAQEAWFGIESWWTTDILTPLSTAWGSVSEFFSGLIGDGETGISGMFSGLWSDIQQIWKMDIIECVKATWSAVGTWFKENVTDPIVGFFNSCVNGIIDAINWVIGKFNALNFDIPAIPGLWDGFTIGVGHIEPIAHIGGAANGAYDIPNGDLFIANEKGAELVGSMDGKTTVANQGQIIEGIQRGVSDANAEQNGLLRQQNDLLRMLIEKSGRMEVHPSAEWGEFNQRSAEMWGRATGR